ncbi:carboxypeptidase-like regulatory domain-containing protein [Chitinophaga rhizosphaerae]|uniref:carboxypeptidase-like regulatory domain-containing protein n=1 Tax=Chitinophaga rhizosphaerae TaxID=1864947 RepID=UPI000F811FE3|nr:carboxypeptidase-like regulatory domain-containing protein [Chitinophaga rhizosphaerae]
MKKLITPIIILAIAALACKKDDNKEGGNGNPQPQKGYVTGKVVNAAGTPIKGVKIIIDHSIFWNSNLTTSTKDDGTYSVKIPIGSWYAFAENTVEYNGRKFKMDLHPDNSDGFGGDGAVRNFTWKLSGEKTEPLTGTYGGVVEFNHTVGEFEAIEDREIVWTFTPSGPLIDGSAGKVLTLKSANGNDLRDVPIGRYKVTATYEGKALKLRKWRTQDAFGADVTFDFYPTFESFCNNCQILEYKIK